MANCFCLQEGFFSIDGGCNAQTGETALLDAAGAVIGTGVNAVVQPIVAAGNVVTGVVEDVGDGAKKLWDDVFGGRKLLQNNCGSAGSRPDKCTIKVQCNFKAVTAGNCGDDVSSEDFSSDLFNPNRGFNNVNVGVNPNNGGFNNPNNGGFNNPNNGGIPGFINPAAGCVCEGRCGPLQRTPQFCYNGGTGSCMVNPARCAGQSFRQVAGNYYLCC